MGQVVSGRHPHTRGERRDACGLIMDRREINEGCVLIKFPRRFKDLPTEYNDIFVYGFKNWKRFRKNQYKTKEDVT
jgi:hypothetical protein